MDSYTGSNGGGGGGVNKGGYYYNNSQGSANTHNKNNKRNNNKNRNNTNKNNNFATAAAASSYNSTNATGNNLHDLDYQPPHYQQQSYQTNRAKFANQTNRNFNQSSAPYFNNNINNNKQKQQRGNSNNYNNSNSNTVKNGFPRHESFDERLNKSVSKDRQSANNSFTEHSGNSLLNQIQTSFSLDNIKQVNSKSPVHQSPGKSNNYAFLSSNIDPYAVTRKSETTLIASTASAASNDLSQEETNTSARLVLQDKENLLPVSPNTSVTFGNTHTPNHTGPVTNSTLLDFNQKSANTSTNNSSHTTATSATVTTTTTAENFETPNDSISFYSTPLNHAAANTTDSTDKLDSSSSNLSPIHNYLNYNSSSSSSSNLSTNVMPLKDQHDMDIMNMINDDMQQLNSPSSSSNSHNGDDSSQALITASEGESSFGVEHCNVEKTITNMANDTSFTTSLDKVAIENFILNLQNQVGPPNSTSVTASLTVNDILTTDIELSSPRQASIVHNVSSSSNANSSKLSIDEEATKKLEDNLSTTSGSQSETTTPAPIIIIDEITVSHEITTMVNNIVSDAVIKAQKLVEEEERLMVNSYDMVNKHELSARELEQIEREQRSVDLAEIKLEDSGAHATYDRNTNSVVFSASPAAKSTDQTVIVNESNTTLNSTTASSKKASNKKSPDVDCFSCTVL